eukprot:GFYU01003193.1.p1 GENE.GFYU01003193.1~~GFYU01003193.1.p1  ORF type:complete len:347 (-),score=75.21 GFYU01003193.1:843-1766(-)
MGANTVTNIRVAGVPEHFNAPWVQGVESGAFKKAGLNVQWAHNDLGTGAMCKALGTGDIDVAVALTEGVISDIVKGGKHQILGGYVDSPLCWGVHVAAGSSYNSVESLRGKIFGISRYGSGSHLMACVQAKSLGWDLEKDIQFRVVGNMNGAREAFNKGEIDAFMWEFFTTKLHVDSGEWRRAGTFDTPWPCFVVTVRNDFVEKEGLEPCLRMLSTVREIAASFQANAATSIPYVCENHGLNKEDAELWFSRTRWAPTEAVPSVKKSNIEMVASSLEAASQLTTELSSKLLENPSCVLSARTKLSEQ